MSKDVRGCKDVTLTRALTLVRPQGMSNPGRFGMFWDVRVTLTGLRVTLKCLRVNPNSEMMLGDVEDVTSL
jgi:hypothetical protein